MPSVCRPMMRMQRDNRATADRPCGASLERAAGLVCGFLYSGQELGSCPSRGGQRWSGTTAELFPRVGFIVTNLKRAAKRVVRFYKTSVARRKQWIKEGKNAVKWTRLSCHDFADNQVRLQLFVLAYNLATSCGRRCCPSVLRH